MKKVLFISLIILFGIVLSLFTFLEIKTNLLKNQNNELKKEITRISDNNNLIKEENVSYEEKLNNLKTEKEKDLKEVTIWTETKEKIEKALS